MLITKRQKNPIIIDGTEVTINEDMLNISFIASGHVITAEDIKSYVTVEKGLSKADYETIGTRFSEKEINDCVVSQIKSEYSVCLEKALLELDNYKKGIISDYLKDMLQSEEKGLFQ